MQSISCLASKNYGSEASFSKSIVLAHRPAAETDQFWNRSPVGATTQLPTKATISTFRTAISCSQYSTSNQKVIC